MIGFIVVSHSDKVANGVVEICKQFHENAIIVAAGGIDNRIGTDVLKIKDAIDNLNDKCSSILIFGDLGSSILSAETAIDLSDDDIQQKIKLVDAPIVEGMIAAVVTSSISNDIDEIINSAKETRIIDKF